MDTNRYLNWAAKIANELEKQAITHWDYTAWPRFGRQLSNNRGMKGLDYDLYSGCTGVALFYAALYKQMKDQKHRRLALQSIYPLLKRNYTYFRTAKDQPSKPLSITIGYSAYLYAIASIAVLLEEDLLPEINYYMTVLTKKHILSDRHYDMMHGSAGAIMALLKCHEITGQTSALELAVFAGRHITHQHEQSSLQKMLMHKVDTTSLTGFSHGIAGISYALIKLYGYSKEIQFLQAGKRFIQLGRHLDNPIQKNGTICSQKQSKTELEWMNSWCNGAAGIGLGRLGCFQYWSDAEMLAEINDFYDVVVQSPYSDNHYLCCGNFGRLEFLINYALKIKQDSGIVCHYADALLIQLDERYRNNVWAPFGFFQGLSGIGYQMLRMIDPKSYASVLLFE